MIIFYTLRNSMWLFSVKWIDSHTKINKTCIEKLQYFWTKKHFATVNYYVINTTSVHLYYYNTISYCIYKIRTIVMIVWHFLRSRHSLSSIARALFLGDLWWRSWRTHLAPLPAIYLYYVFSNNKDEKIK